MSVDPKLKKKKDEEAQQIWIGIDPPAKQCKRCMFAADDTEYTVGAEMAYCDIYEMSEDSDGKPDDILWDKAECEFFVENPYGGDV